MPYALGIDVGTTSTAAAIWDGDRVEVAAFEAHRVAVPTVVFADGDHVLFGTAAASRGNAHPTGVAREFKRRFGDSVPLVVSGATYSADHLLALFVRWVVDAVTEQRAGPPARIVVTHPANWTAFQLNLLAQALREVGLLGVALCSEPEAAATDYAASADLAAGELVLVYDLGGGTFDVALLRRGPRSFTFVGDATGVERLGGIDFDEAVFQHVLRHLPEEAVARVGADPAGMMAIAQLRRACTEAKEELSSSSTVEIPVMLGASPRTVRLARAELEAMIRPMLRQTVELVQQVLRSAGVGAEALGAALLVGGASRTPLVAELVGATLGTSVRLDAHPKLVVARGAARRAGAEDGTTTARPRPRPRPARRAVVAGAGLVAVAALGAGALRLAAHRDDDGAGPLSVVAVEPIGTSVLPVDATVEGSTVGGLSGLAYDAARDAYYAVSDETGSPRFFALHIDLAGGALRTDGVELRGVTVLRPPDGQPALDPAFEADAIAVVPGRDHVLVGDEGGGPSSRHPATWGFALDGASTGRWPAPAWYAPTVDGPTGLHREGISALTTTPGGRVVVGMEEALRQDLPLAGGGPLIARVLVHDDVAGPAVAEHGYPLGEAGGPPPVDGLGSRLTELAALDDHGTVLALEVHEAGTPPSRSVRLYETRLVEPPGDVAPGPTTPAVVAKRLVVDLGTSGLPDAWYGGMALGPELGDGRRALLLVSDNGFVGPTHVVAFAVRLGPAAG